VSNVPAAAANPMVAVIMANQKALRTVIPKHMDADRMCRLALVSTQKNPKLLLCSPASLIGSLLTATQLGLEPGVGGHGELIPFKGRGGYECQFMPGYKGLMDLARRSGQVGAIAAEVVHDQDEFRYQLGTSPSIHHVPAGGDRGAVTHVYATAHLVATDEYQFVVMTKQDIEQVRQSSRSGQTGPWVSHWDEMARKTAIRRLCKLLPMSVNVQRAIALDEMAEAGVPQQNDAILPLDMDLQIPVDADSKGGDSDG